MGEPSCDGSLWHFRRCDMTVEEFNPNLLMMTHQSYCMHYEQESAFTPRITRWHEMDIITYGRGKDVVSGVEYPVETGDVFYRPSGVHNVHYRPYYCYFLVFDPMYHPSHEAAYSVDTIGENNHRLVNDWQPIPPFSFATGPKLGKLDDIEPVFRKAILLQEVWENKPQDKYRVKCLFMDLILEIRRQFISEHIQVTLPPRYMQYAQQVQDLMYYIRRTPNENYSITRMAGMMRLSPNFFSHVFHVVTGDTPMHFVHMVKLNQIKALLLDSELSVIEIANECNIDANYIYVLFKRYMHITPLEYRKDIVKEKSKRNDPADS
jgi:AraC-like DNA-binding protein